MADRTLALPPTDTAGSAPTSFFNPKSDFRVEHLLFRTADRLLGTSAINEVIAWRIMLMNLLGRQVPDRDPEMMFSGPDPGLLRDCARTHDPYPDNRIMRTGYGRLTSARGRP